MNKKPSGTPGPSIFLFRLFASQAAMMSLAFPLHAGAQQPQETSFNQPTTTASMSAELSVPLVDAPSAVLSRAAAATINAAPLEMAAAGVVRPPPAKLTREEKILSEAQRNTACEEGKLHGKPCRVSWPRVLGESFLFLAAQHGGNIAMDHDTRDQLTHGDFWQK
jgi:hypothetical protein